MNRTDQILATENFVRMKMQDYDSSHDWWHIERVRKLALLINESEKLEIPFIVEIAALLHDSADSKFAGENTEEKYSSVIDFMVRYEMPEIMERVMNVIRHVSFSSRNKEGVADDPLLWIIQDADKLDAIGAVGVARAFSYGGFRNNVIYDPGIDMVTGLLPPSTIRHFYDKLLKLNDMLNTGTAKRIGEQRHAFLEAFLKQFYEEWQFSLGLPVSEI